MEPLVSDSITKIPPDARGRALVCASHGGLYAARCAVHAGLPAVLFNDAGIGKDRAGVAGLALLDGHGIASAAVSHRSARIGDGADAIRRGVVSEVNARAAAAGVRVGMAAVDAWRRLVAKPVREERAAAAAAPIDERSSWSGGGAMPVVVIDSISLVTAADRDAVVVTGSHGGLLGGDPRSACAVDVFAAVFNDADVGIDDAGIGRLAPLDARGIAAVTVGAWTARIGDARSSLDDGVISHANARAARLGARRGQELRRFIETLADTWAPSTAERQP